MKPVNFIDPSAVVPESTRVWHFARILSGAVLGEDTSIGSGAEIGQNSIIGARVRISAGVFLPSCSYIGNDVFIGPNVTFTDDRYPRAGNKNYKAEPPVVEAFASIGAGATILPGVRIGTHSLIGAGAVVTRDVPPYSTFYGPAAKEHATPREMAVSVQT